MRESRRDRVACKIHSNKLVEPIFFSSRWGLAEWCWSQFFFGCFFSTSSSPLFFSLEPRFYKCNSGKTFYIAPLLVEFLPLSDTVVLTRLRVEYFFIFLLVDRALSPVKNSSDRIRTLLTHIGHYFSARILTFFSSAGLNR